MSMIQRIARILSVMRTPGADWDHPGTGADEYSGEAIAMLRSLQDQAATRLMVSAACGTPSSSE